MSRSLQFDIVGNDKASASLNAVQAAAGKFAKQLSGYFAGFFSAQAVIGNILGRMQQAFNWGSQLKDNAAAVGLSVEQFQQLEYAAGQAGVSAEKMHKAFNELRKRMRDAGEGSKEAMAVMNALGFSSEQVASGNINLMDAFMRVSQAISSASSEQEKFNIATAIFGDRISLDLMRALQNYGDLKKKIGETPLITKEEAETLDRMADLKQRLEKRAEVSFAQLMTDPRSLMLLFGGTAGIGALANLEKQMREARGTPLEADMTPEKARDMARELAQAGKKNAGSNVAAATAAGGSTLTAAAIGGAAGFRPSMAGSPELSTLEQIERNTRPTQDIPLNGQTNFTTAEQGSRELSQVVARMRMSTAPTRPRNIPR